MDLLINAIFVSDTFNKFEPDDRHQVSRERVQDFIDSGLINKDAILQRYTKYLSNKLEAACDESITIENFKYTFQYLCNHESRYISSVKFQQLILEKLSESGVKEPSEYPELLLNILIFYAFFPFPTSFNELGAPKIDENAYIRAISLLTIPPVARIGDDSHFSDAVPSLRTGTWGPHDGFGVSNRGQDASDVRRRIFRSLATPLSHPINGKTTIPVPRFVWFDTEQGGTNSDDQTMAVMEKEDEKDVDILDVLVQTTPGATMKIASPYRESYNLALPLLPKYNNDLLELQIPTAKLAAFLKLVEELEPGRESSLAKLTEDLEGSEGISYEVFNTMLSTYSELLFDALMKIFWSLQM